MVQRREVRRKTNKKLIASLKRRLGETEAVMWKCETCRQVFDDYHFGGSWLQRQVNEIDDLVESCKDKFMCKADEEPSRVNIGSLVNRLRLMGLLYFDLTKDTGLFVSLRTRSQL